MKKIALLSVAIASGLALTTVAEARAHMEKPAFGAVDADANGQVTPEELTAHREAQAAARFAAADANADGKLSADELAAAADGRRAARLARMIERLDSDGDGMLGQAEMEAAKQMRGPGRRGGERGERGGRAQAMFERADADGNGTLSAEEWDALGKRR